MKTAPKKSNHPTQLAPRAILPQGWLGTGLAAGLKASGAPDMAMVFSERPADAVATFTTNQVCAATVRLDRDRIERLGMTHGVVVNSGQANACTGKPGLADAAEMAAYAGKATGVAPEMFLVCSTGRIGIRLDMAKIRPGIDRLAAALQGGEAGGKAAATGILTTDTRPKHYTATFTTGDGTRCRVTGFAKGAGMIQPNMATMLAFILTDAKVRRGPMQKLFREAVANSFNRITVDGDESTNDSAFLLANGAAGNAEALRPGVPGWEDFATAVRAITRELAKDMVRDGEGAAKFVTVQVTGARNAADAEAAARAVGNSLLVKTSWAGGAPNWGRVMDALGYSAAKVVEEKVDIAYDGLQAVAGGTWAGKTTEAALRKVLAGKEFTLAIDLHLGRGAAEVFACDCTEAYVQINRD